MCVNLPSVDLNPNPYPLYPTKTCEMTIAPRVRDGW